jgi:hypothetical protein
LDDAALTVQPIKASQLACRLDFDAIFFIRALRRGRSEEGSPG